MFSVMSVGRILILCAAFAAQAHCAERIALLPFADPEAHGDAKALINVSARAALFRRKLDLIPEDSVAQVLRELRIRNTATPSSDEIRAVADSLGAEFVLVGTIHQFNVNETFTEATISARLIHAAEARMVWSNWVAVTGGGETALFSKPVIENPKRVARAIARKLFATIRTTERLNAAQVTAIYSKLSAPQNLVACSKIAIIPLFSESPESQSGQMIADLLVTELSRKGFNVAEPGSVRNVMLACDDLRHGQSVDPVSKALADSLGVDVVLTGTISSLTDSRSAILGTIPEVGLEMRMIDANAGTLIWARNLERHGAQQFAPFMTGITHSPAKLTQKLIRDMVDDLPTVRKRTTS
ncbi:MAG: hypothetical protein IPG71_04720 [bacterium]|nr:hypothetical protein [bacterium]